MGAQLPEFKHPHVGGGVWGSGGGGRKAKGRRGPAILSPGIHCRARDKPEGMLSAAELSSVP